MIGWIILGIIIGVSVVAPVVTGGVGISEVLAQSEEVISKGIQIFEVIMK